MKISEWYNYGGGDCTATFETQPVGVYIFDYFSIDIVNDKFHFGGEEYFLGEFSKDIANTSEDFIEKLLVPAAKINESYHKIRNERALSDDDFTVAKDNIYEIIDQIKNVKPFCYYDLEHSKEKIDLVFQDEFIKGYVSPETQEDNDRFDYAVQSMLSYIYLVNDIANFRKIAIDFTDFFMSGDSRRKEDIAISAFCFFRDKSLVRQLNTTKQFDILNGISLRPWVMQVPTIVPILETDFAIARRLYFTRFMDFLITELFEALSHGHYLWRCCVCGKYFLMTTARRQLYCSDVNEEYGAPCSYAASHPDVINKKLEKESKKNSPVYDLWQKRYNSIRKDKSNGKINKAISAEAKKIIDAKRDRARIDFEYAKNEYEKEMDLKIIYEEAIRNVDG